MTTPFQLPADIERFLAALAKLYRSEGKSELESILVNSAVSMDQAVSGWGGNETGHDLTLRVPESLYLKIVRRKSKIETSICADLRSVVYLKDEFIESVRVEMEPTSNEDWRGQSDALIPQKRVIAPVVEQRVWGAGEKFRIFLSHNTKDKKETAVLRARLELFGASCFVAHEDIRPTKDWRTEIEAALFSADALVALLTDRFHESLWTDQELGVAIGREIPILSVRLGADPYGFIGKFQALRSSWDAAPKEIARIFVKHERMLDSYIGAIETCRGFDAGNELATLLPEIGEVSTQQVDRLVAAFNGSSQISGSFGFSGDYPSRYGPGLAHHLERWTGTTYVVRAGVIAPAKTVRKVD